MNFGYRTPGQPKCDKYNFIIPYAEVIINCTVRTKQNWIIAWALVSHSSVSVNGSEHDVSNGCYRQFQIEQDPPHRLGIASYIVPSPLRGLCMCTSYHI